MNSLVGTIWEDQIFGWFFLILYRLEDDQFGGSPYQVLYSDYTTGIRLHDELIEQIRMNRLA